MTKRKISNNMPTLTLAAATEVYEAAVADLGPELCGLTVASLLCDNFNCTYMEADDMGYEITRVADLDRLAGHVSNIYMHQEAAKTDQADIDNEHHKAYLSDSLTNWAAVDSAKARLANSLKAQQEATSKAVAIVAHHCDVFARALTLKLPRGHTVTHGYIGNVERWGDDRSWRFFYTGLSQACYGATDDTPTMVGHIDIFDQVEAWATQLAARPAKTEIRPGVYLVNNY